MRGQRPFASNIAPELDALIAEACAICEAPSMPNYQDIERLRNAGKVWDAAGRPLKTAE
jgi:hypothetical protein